MAAETLQSLRRGDGDRDALILREFGRRLRQRDLQSNFLQSFECLRRRSEMEEMPEQIEGNGGFDPRMISTTISHVLSRL